MERTPNAEALGAGLGSFERGLAKFYSRANGFCIV